MPDPQMEVLRAIKFHTHSVSFLISEWVMPYVYRAELHCLGSKSVDRWMCRCQFRLHCIPHFWKDQKIRSFTPKLPTGVCLGSWLSQEMIGVLFYFLSWLYLGGLDEFHIRLTLTLLVFLLLCTTVQCPSDGSGCREAVSMGIVRTSPHGVHN